MADVRFIDDAAAEYEHERRLYANRAEQAAEGFEAAVAEAVKAIGEDPHRFPACDEPGFRFAILKRYPFSLIFPVTDAEAQVVAVAHAKRKPGYWSGRA